MTLLRSKPLALDAYFGEIGVGSKLASTQATVHCRYLKLDGSNTPRVKDLAERLAQELINYSIPRSEIEAAFSTASGPHDAKQFSKLHRKAARLFTDVANTGEGGELLLYLMTETYLRIPQLFCKMPLKTNPQVHYHGTDGIHGSYDPGTGALALYWGESKLYQNLGSALNACMSSLAPFVLPSGGSAAPQTRDIQLLSDNIDLGDQGLENAILRYLDKDDPLYNKMTYRGVALVGFDSPSYVPNSPPLVESALTTALSAALATWHDSAGKHISDHKLSQIGIELFCVPFPSVEEFRQAFIQELGLG